MNSDISFISKQVSFSLRLGDLSTAYSLSKRISILYDMEEGSYLEKAEHYSQLASICTALDNFPEAMRHYEHAVECYRTACQTDKIRSTQESMRKLMHLDSIHIFDSIAGVA